MKISYRSTETLFIVQDDKADRILIDRISVHDEFAFEEFIKRYQRRIFKLIYRYTRSVQDTEELAQDVFVKVWESAESFKGKSRVFTWVYRIAVNIAINHVKRKLSYAKYIKIPILLENDQAMSRMSAPYGRQPDSLLEEKALKSLVKDAMQKLPATQRMAFILSKYENYSYAEISEIMDTSVPTVRSLLYRAKISLRKYLLPFRVSFR